MGSDDDLPEKRRGVAILVPVTDSVPGMFVASFVNLYTGIISKGMAVTSFVNEAIPLDKARHILLDSALAMKPELEYILWLDADMLPHSSHLNRLMGFLDSHPEYDAASALYFRKTGFEPLCYRKIAPGKRGTKVALEWFMPEGTAPQEIDAAGLGFMLIRTSSIKEKLLPSLAGKRILFWFDPEGHSEDVNFCLLMREAGLRIAMLPDVVVPHIGGYVTAWHHRKKAEDEKGSKPQ